MTLLIVLEETLGGLNCFFISGLVFPVCRGSEKILLSSGSTLLRGGPTDIFVEVVLSRSIGGITELIQSSPFE